MTFAITGLENTNEFYSQHYLDEIVENDLKPLFNRWKEQGAASPIARRATCAGLRIAVACGRAHSAHQALTGRVCLSET